MEKRDAAQVIIHSVSAMDAAERLGLKPNRAGFCRCPFHDDHDASMKLYDGRNGFFCFGCGKGGDVIRLVRDVNQCSFSDALDWLNSAFKLGLDISSTTDKKALESQKNALKREMLRKECERTADNALFDAYCMAQMLVCELDEEKERYRPRFDDEWDERFCTALKLLAEARELTEQLATKVIGVKKDE